MLSQTNLRQFLVLIVLGVILLAGLPACRQQEQPRPVPAPATQPQPPATMSQPTAPLQEMPSSQPVETQPATQPAEPQRSFRVTDQGVKPDQPLSILSKTDADQPARISASLQSDHFLVIETANVSLLRLDLVNLPRKETGRLVLQIDGKGLEITGRGNKVVYLQRNSVGNWTFSSPPTAREPGRSLSPAPDQPGPR